MAETLTYDAGTDTISREDNLTSEEQDSLKVGEELISQQDQLLAGKYKDAQELEKAYVELTKKLGEDKQEETPKIDTQSEDEPKSEKEEEPDNSTILEDLWEQAQEEDFKKETLDQIVQMDQRDLANMYLQYRAKNSPQQLSQEDVKSLKDIAGGDKGYSSMLEWANSNLQSKEIDMFDAVMEKGDPLSAFFAVRSLAYRYEDAMGRDGKMTTGTAPKTSGDIFRSQQEVVAAMSDPRYDVDPAYRRDIMNKLERSNIQF